MSIPWGCDADMSGLMRRLVDRLTSSAADAEAEELQQRSQAVGASPIRECSPGDMVSATGRIRALTLRPVGGVPALEAELYDGTASVVLIWLGRRRIGGIEPGRTLSVTGRVTTRGKERVMFNPAYELKT
jgi:hypothetical protein